ncbi:CHAT domain protein (plasmid) [Sulfitobacter sp. THAF37]|uniref:CHAT domain-containing tetratricopeptide repeat protein n=1 Tax=Sulfitobacter sp. THAF37 TaxID=2587855 RepID=UPI0012A9BC44|nr:CHAT domain-containing tetratricopeptide repeat protein [Sulfitobacter sp. THAF37]QFT61027.1 CHAT domain protein [Sulfitobacter sp. THAF37]
MHLKVQMFRFARVLVVVTTFGALVPNVGYSQNSAASRTADTDPSKPILAVDRADIDALIAQGLKDEEAGNHLAAATKFEKALTAFRGRFGDRMPDVLPILEHNSRALWLAGEADSSLAYQSEALRLARTHFPATDPALLLGIENLASHLITARQHEKAVPLLREVKEIRKQTLGPEHRDTIEAIVRLYYALRYLQRHEAALGEAELALELSLAVLGETTVATENRRIENAYTLERLGRMDEARIHLEAALAARLNAVGPNDKGTINVARYLAQNLTRANKPERAAEAWENVLEWSSAVYGTDSEQTLEPLRQLGHLYRISLRDPAAALASYERGFKNSTRIHGPDHEVTLVFMSMYSLELGDMGRTEEAYELQRELVPLSQQVLGPGHLDTLYRVGALVRNLRTLGRGEEASQLLLEGMQIAAQIHGDESHVVKTSLGTSIASIDTDAPNATLIKTLRNGVERYKASTGTSAPATLNLMYTLTKALSANGQELEAVEVWSDIVSAHQLRMSLTASLDETTRRGVINDARDIGVEFANAAWRATPENARPAENYLYRSKSLTHTELKREMATEAFQAAQVSQTGAAYALARAGARTALRQAGLQDIYAAYEASQSAAMDLSNDISRHLGQQTGLDPSADPELISLQTQRQAAIDEVRAVEKKLKAEFPRFFDLVVQQPVSVDELQGSTEADALLGPNEVLLVLVPPKGNLHGYVWAVTRDELAWAPISLSEDALRTDLERLHGLLDSNGATQIRGAPAGDRGSFNIAGDDSAPDVSGFDRSFAHALYTELLGDPAIQDVAADKPEWILAPQGMLLSLPFAALVSEEPTGGKIGDADPAALRATSWLGTRRALSVLPAVSSLRVLRGFSASADRRADRPFFGVGDPDFNGSTTGGEPVEIASAETFFRDGVADAAHVRQLSRLPGTRSEINALSAIFGASADATLLGSAASESGLARAQATGALSRARVVVFATHGLMAGAFEGLAEPALALTPPTCGPTPIGRDQSDGTASCKGPSQERALTNTAIQGGWIDDGLLTSSEVLQLDMDADWVILSACDTAAGADQTPDAEGLSGLARAFFFSGARSLLVSHWPVRDDVASQLTPDAVARAQREDISTAEALRQAMTALMMTTGSDAVGRSFAHPSAWAPFQLTGVDVRKR